MIGFRSPPDGLLTPEQIKHDAQLDPDIIAWNPFASDDCLNAFASADQFLLTKTEELHTMNACEDEPSSGLNGRLRPRKSTVLGSQTNSARRADSRTLQDRPKRTNTPSKASPNKTDDLANKSDATIAPQHLCPYCDSKFASKQTVSKHARRIHLSASKQDSFMGCLFCNHIESLSNDIIRHMVDSHPNQYFACLDCHTRFHSTSELAEHKHNVCEKQKSSYRSKLRQKTSSCPKKVSKKINAVRKGELRIDGKQYSDEHGFNGIVISCELKPSQMHDAADIEDNIPTNLILPSSKNIRHNSVLEKNAVIVLDDIQWNKRMPSNFSFHNTDADQILSRLGVIHRSPRAAETTRRDWLRTIDDTSQKFEKCFDTNFYSKVASNVQENLAKFLDGSFNYNPDPDNTIKTRKSKNSVVINTAEGFPILLASEQYSRNVFDGYMPRAIAPKHKWKWDSLENDKSLINPDQIKRDSHVNNCIITLVSSLDIWTQLCMRQKFEDKFKTSPIGKKIEKRNIIGKQLKEILESRELPASSSQVVKFPSRPAPTGEALEFPASLGLRPAAPRFDVQPAVLSGEWVRPRCYVCCACGAQTRDARALSAHMSTQHPNAQVQHYEIVGELLLNADILKHLYVPPSQTCNRTRPLRGFRECTKCSKSITLEDLHQHMLDCAGDTPAVRRKCRYRPFGVRRRRPRFPDNTIRKKIRKDIRNRQEHKGLIRQRSRPKTKTEVGDAETIRKMIADLPAKRHRVMVNPMNPMLRPRRKLNKQRNKMLLKRRSTEDPKTRRLRIKEVNNSGETETSSKATRNQTITTSKDKNDEDDLPLKPKVKRVIASNTRQSDILKRKAVLNRAKRRIAREKIMQEVLESPMISASDNQNHVLSNDNVPERIDVNNGPYNVREHSNRGGSNNRNDQPGCSGQRGNVNNPCAPAQNAPLKHSIARLTANTETHDKSVQFHQLFLVQQECNSVTQHLPTQRQELFENEAVVTRLDKPPLHYPTEQLDPYAVQKSKISKPRKGLNDCIAMLKNKLVEPAPCVPTGQVSVQCGSDEPIDQNPVLTLPNTMCHINMKPAEIFYRPISTQKFIEPGPSSQSLQKPVIQHYHYNPSPDKVITPQTEKGKTRQKKHAAVPERASLRQNQVDFVVKRKSTRQRSNAQSEIESLKKLIGLPPQIDIIPKQYELHSVNSTFTRSRRDSYKRIEPQNIVQPKPNDLMLHKQKQTPTKTTTRGPQKKSLSLKLAAELTLQVQRPQRNEPKSHYVEQKSPGSNKNQQTVQPIITFASEENLSQQQPVKAHTQSSPRIISNDVYSERRYNNTTICMSSAHDTTNIESNVSVPLDLSGKYITGNCSKNLTKQTDSYGENNYDSYETLDLSSKYFECSTAENDNNTNDVVVDLRMNYSEETPPQAVIDVCDTLPQNENDTVTDLSVKDQDYEHTPTDLSIKGNPTSAFPVNTLEDMSCIAQDLSGHLCNEFNTAEDINYAAHDLSGRFNNTINESEDVNYEAHDLSGHSHVISEVEDVNYTVEDLSRRSSNAMNRDENVNHVTQDLTGRAINAMKRAEDVNYMVQDIPERSTNAIDVSKDENYEAQDLTKCLADADNTSGDGNQGVHNLSGHSPVNAISEETIDLSRNTEVDDNLPTDLSGKRVNDHSMISSPVVSPRPPHIGTHDTRERDLKGSLELPKTVECVADLSTKISKEEHQAHLSTVHIKPVTKIEVSKSATQVNKSNEKLISRTTPTQVITESPGPQKPVYDPTLKIPQYKIRVTMSTTGTTTSSLSDSISYSSNSIATRTRACSPLTCESAPTLLTYKPNQTVSKFLVTSTPERGSYDLTAVPYNVSVSPFMRSLPVYTLPNTLPTTPISKFENTKPVYTLTNACISVTKIESTRSTILTNSLLSVPGTTIANTTSVYTLAGTTCGSSINYGVSPNNTPSIVLAPNNRNFMNSAILPASHTTREQENQCMRTELERKVQEGENNTNAILTIDQDSETARKIAMLPKELVEILGTIPADHRNQLLNVLPQYVSKSTHTSCLRSDISSQGMTMKLVPSSKDTDSISLAGCQAATLSMEIKDIITSVHQNVPIIETNTSFSYDKISDSRNLSSQIPVSLQSENKHSMSFLVPPPPVPSVVKTQTISGDSKPPPEITNNINLNVDPLSLYPRPISKRSIETGEINKVDLIKVIDLTDDENCRPEIEINKVTDKIVCPVIIQPQDISGYIVPKSKKPKVNDQTASLRAVRIKAPSERHKLGLTDNQTIIKNLTEQISNTLTNDTEDNEANKSSDSDKTLAIQQAEVSSTQHGSKNVVADGPFLVAISPTNLEVSAEETNNKKPLQVLIPTVEIPIKVAEEQFSTEKPTAKTGLVTSSIPAKSLSHRKSNDVRTCVNTAGEVVFNENSSKNNSVLQDQDVLETTEVNWSNAPIQTSTPKQKLELIKDLIQPTINPKNNGNCSSDDDSEDDVSLATIVKQKQRDQQVIAPVGGNTFDNTEDKQLNQTKKKEYKLKKTKKQFGDESLNEIRKEKNADVEQCKANSIKSSNISYERNSVSKHENKEDSDKNIIHSATLTNDNTDSNNYINHNYSRNSNISHTKDVIVYNKGSKDLQYENDIIKRSHYASDCSMIKAVGEKTTSPEGPAIKNTEATPLDKAPTVIEHELSEEHDVARTDIRPKDSFEQACDSGIIENEETNISHTKKEDISLQTDVAKHGKQYISNITKLGDGCSTSIENVIKRGHDKLTDSKNNEKPIQDTDEKEISTIEFHVDKTENLGFSFRKDISDETVTGDAKSESNNNKNPSLTRNTGATDNVETSFVGDLKLCSKIEEKIINPLRRSRRGKSMFVDGSALIENDYEDSSEALFQEKAPITKKQLIFSKLLLDEEKQCEMKSHSSSKITAHVQMQNNLTNTNHDDLNQSSRLTRVANVPLHDKNKPSYKRKKSPQETRKWKKKKSADQYHLEKYTDIDNSLHVNKNIKLVTYSHACGNVDALVHSCTGNICVNVHLTNKSIHMLQTSESKIQDLPDNITKPTSTSVSMSIPKEKKVTEDTCTVHCEKLITEKRKLNIPTICADLAENTKPKKSKMSAKMENIYDSSLNDNCTENKITTSRKENSNAISVIRTTCYNRPIAARRTRSKSVVVKSSVNEFYDPYDIDLDDMIEKTEPIIKKRQTGKKNALSFTVDRDFIQQNNSRNMTTKTFSKKTEIAIGTPLKVKDGVDIRARKYLNTSVEAMDHMEDSNDSSKSDVPLQKYVQDKEKKTLEDHKIAITERDNEDDLDACDVSNEKLHDKDLRKSRRTLAVFNNVDGVGSPNETDEQLRSEQFMESFGFFSERKPRKSNLLASKKISETFHLIANESDDIYFGFKDRTVKRSSQNENRKSVDGESISRAPQPSPSKKSAKRGRKKKSCTKIAPSYCSVCKKEFRRPDNYLRHLMTLLHISKLSEVEMKVKTVPVLEEPNYLIVYKQHLDRLKILTDKLAKRKKNSKSTSKIVLPTMEEILADVKKTVREQQLSQRGLSRDEALFIDCCELLQEAHKSDHGNTEAKGSVPSTYRCSRSISELDILSKQLDYEKCDSKSDGDVDSITAKNILESEEVRNLENDLISGLKEAANANNAHNASNMSYQHVMDSAMMQPSGNGAEACSSQEIMKDKNYAKKGKGKLKEEHIPKKVKKTEVKDKMYPDVIENIDMFEDKFDKIKRKCRSQAAAAKQVQPVVEPCTRHKIRKKKKRKRTSKKSCQNTQVLTKGALKGFDGIKVSIPTSDINMSGIMPSLEIPVKKKKKKSISKKKRDKKDSESSSKYESDYRVKDNSPSQRKTETSKKVDVYEFMDNDDAELFEFRPSTLMERFKSISNKDTPSTSKLKSAAKEIDNSSDTASDGDDFVYMSDDYVCSDDETENSLLSCELGIGKVTSDVKKSSSSMKRKDAVEKNAVMGKIFKHNAVRTEKKTAKCKDHAKPKANLDQLFDSLLEDEPTSSMLNNDMSPPRRNESLSPIKRVSYHDTSPRKDEFSSPPKFDSSSSKEYEFISPKKYESTSKKHREHINYGPSTSKAYDTMAITDYGPSTSKKYEKTLRKEDKSALPKKRDSVLSDKFGSSKSKNHNVSPKYGNTSPTKSDDVPLKSYESKKKWKGKSPLKKRDEGIGSSHDYSAELTDQVSHDDMGVARQRARRKCTVGKQNVLAETWSSESEPDGVPPRPTSAESVLLSSGRKKKGKKKEGQQSVGRKCTKHVTFKKQDTESRVTSSKRHKSRSGSRRSRVSRRRCESEGANIDDPGPSTSSAVRRPSNAGTSSQAATFLQPGSRARPRVVPHRSSEGDDEQEHLQQHGWIVGDSHKKLVTMLAYAKGPGRTDDRRNLVE